MCPGVLCAKFFIARIDLIGGLPKRGLSSRSFVIGNGLSRDSTSVGSLRTISAGYAKVFLAATRSGPCCTDGFVPLSLSFVNSIYQLGLIVICRQEGTV